MGIILKVSKEALKTERQRSQEMYADVPLECLLDDHIPCDDGIVYVLLMVNRYLEKFVKIGVTKHSKVDYRVGQIVNSYFVTNRYYPMVYPKRFQRFQSPFTVEKLIKDHFAGKERQFDKDKKFSGYTECYDVPLSEVVELYDKLAKEHKKVSQMK